MITTKRSTLWNKTQTARAMYSLVIRFATDLGSYGKLSLQDFFDVVRKIPYLRDTKGSEVVARPRLIFSEFPAIDCKKKAILMASWMEINKIPWRFISTSMRKDKRIHHVFAQGFINGEWKNVDPTYSYFRLFQPKVGITKTEILKP